MAFDLHAQQHTLRQQYFKLTDSKRSVVQIFALLYAPFSRSDAYQCWKSVFSAATNPLKIDDPLTSNQFSYQVSQLIKQDLLMQERGQGPCCPDILVDIVVRDAVKTGTFEPIAQAIAQEFPIQKRYKHHGPRYFRQESEFLRELRLAIYRQDMEAIHGLLEELRYVYWRTDLTFPRLLQHILTNPFDPEWFSSLTQEFRQLGLELILDDSVRRGIPVQPVFEFLEDYYEADQTAPDLTLLYAEQLWLRGYLGEASQVLEGMDERGGALAKRHALQGAIAFLTGNTGTALGHYRLGLKAAGKSQSAQAAWFRTPASLLYFFALLQVGSPATYQEAETLSSLLQRQPDHWLQAGMSLMLVVLQIQQGRLSQVADITEQLAHYRLSTTGLATLIEIYSLYWLDAKAVEDWLPAELARLYGMASQAGYGWIALEIAELMTRFHYEEERQTLYLEIVEALRESVGSQPLMEVVQSKEPWELSLSALTNLVETSNPQAAPAPQALRLAWRLRFSSQANWELTPLEQKYSVKGNWTKGKPIALKRLYSSKDMPSYLTNQDRQICDALELDYSSSYYYGSSKACYRFREEALLALIGHPLVFWADTDAIRVDVVAGEPELLVKRLSSDRLRIKLSPSLSTDSHILVFKETPTQLKVVAIEDSHRRIADLLGPNNQLEVPAQAQEQVLEAIASISTLITVQSDIGGGVAAEEVPADSTLRVHLLPAGDGLKVSLLVRPLATGGSYYSPGKGGATVLAEIEGKRLQAQRDLKTERAHVREVKAACPILKEHKATKGEWLIEEPEDCLQLLLQLQAIADTVQIEWPEGETLRVSRQLGISDFTFNIRRQQDWFAASGEVQISDDQVLNIQHLMALLETSPGQFIELSDGQFLALTQEFRSRLQTLQRLSEPHGEGLRIHGLAALAVDSMVDDVEQLKVDKAWKAHLKRIKTAHTIEPQVPATLQANLRDYQQAGYTWLARLAHWGVGACLADDMGLGKTLQAIAVILSRAHDGPTLVVAPTSVCLNWIDEVERFAPSLQLQMFGSSDRQQLLQDIGAGDLLVCSYGLLQQDDVASMLAQVEWHTIVLDEAQAIKNADTKRSQAAMALQGNFKVITTGTPIENHLGELWNLFRFINPGLLGSLDSFNQRFAYPIERDQNEAAREALRRLIQPFILRRTKDQVLKELPSRTEITLQVELSTEELAFYEALRREAIQKLEDSDAPAGQKHLQVLAEIMRLRRACCHPRLVRPELALSSTKLSSFGDILAELLDNNHKALVFSQFVDHLTILRDYLDRQAISYQYLDGSTPANQRQKRVNAFQQGHGDVFLISLKAGGTGLNLTAADYVIHMDPWWNPAVEDQASDRAHRIGQQRPVTIYRLVAKGTIEDKIVALHQTKRDLADSLLQGADVSGKISTDALLALLTDG